jgi:hypothetical protein
MLFCNCFFFKPKNGCENCAGNVVNIRKNCIHKCRICEDNLFVLIQLRSGRYNCGIWYSVVIQLPSVFAHKLAGGLHFSFRSDWTFEDKCIYIMGVCVHRFCSYLTDNTGWGSQISRQSAHEGGKVVSPMYRPPYPQEISWYSFLLEVESTPGP